MAKKKTTKKSTTKKTATKKSTTKATKTTKKKTKATNKASATKKDDPVEEVVLDDAPAEIVAEVTEAAKTVEQSDEAVVVEASDADAEAVMPSVEDSQPVAEEAASSEEEESVAEEVEVAASVADDAEQPVQEEASELTLGQGPLADGQTDEVRLPVRIRGKIDKFGVAMGTGRRKSSVARVRINKGQGKLTINGKPLDEYFCILRDRLFIEAPLHDTETHGKVDVWVRVNGGGTTGQAGAIVLGVARALEAMDPTLHGKLAEGGYLTRDSRMVERKKYGFKKARKSFQFSKR